MEVGGLLSADRKISPLDSLNGVYFLLNVMTLVAVFKTRFNARLWRFYLRLVHKCVCVCLDFLGCVSDGRENEV